MISRIEKIPITKESYPFASAEKYCNLSEIGYEETEYYMYGTANVYETADELGNVRVKTPDAPYCNRFIIRAPKEAKKASGNVIFEIINPTSFMEIDRMWILGQKEFVRNGDIYIGITSKPNTIAKMVEFDRKRYERLSWENPTKDKAFPFSLEDAKERKHAVADINLDYETGLFWDMLTDLSWLIREGETSNPLQEYPRTHLYLTGWSQSACYLLRYINSFAYRTEVAKDSRVFDGYLSGGGVRSLVTPVNQYESMYPYSYRLQRVQKVYQPFIALQTESENGRYESFYTMREDSDRSDFLYRLYEVTGASHDTQYSYIDYYKDDEDLKRIHHLPKYLGKHEAGNDYPSEIFFAAAFRNLFYWVREGVAPNHCERIKVDADGENIKDAFGNTVGGLRSCLLNYPTGYYSNTSTVEKGSNAMDPEATTEGLFGYQKAFPKEMLVTLYGTLDHYKELVTEDTKQQVVKGFVCKEDATDLIQKAVNLAKLRGLI